MRALALAGHMNKKSFEMAVVVADPGYGDILACIGLTEESRRTMSPLTREDYFDTSNRHTDISQLCIDVPNIDKLSAIWVGNEFRNNVNAAGVQQPAIPDETYTINAGNFWLENSVVGFGRMQQWVRQVAGDAFKRKSRAVAELMRWTLPMEPETLAALWYTAENHDKELDFHLQCVPRFGSTREALAEKYNDIIWRYKEKE